MKEWKTEMWLYHTEGHIKTGKVAVQGDSLSPLLFFLALIPLTNKLSKQEAGYTVKGENKVSHLYYMDDLKLFSRDETDLQQEFTTVKTFYDNVRMVWPRQMCHSSFQAWQAS
jgi:hypothetical protein